MKVEVTKNIDSEGKSFLVFTKVPKNDLSTVIGACRPYKSDFEIFKKNYLGEFKDHQIVWSNPSH